MPPSWYQSPPASSMPVAGETIPRQNPAVIRKSGPEIKNQCTKEGVNGENLASIRKSGPEIKNRCTKDGGNRENPVSIRKSGPEIKNRCTKKGVIGEKLASIRKFGLEIKNRCTKQPIFSTLPQQIPQHIPQHAFHHAFKHASCLGCFAWGRARAGLTVAAKAGADAPGGGISLCFCRRGCAAPAQKAATLNDPPRSTRHAQHISAAPTQQAFTLIHSAVFHLIAIGVILLALPYRRLRKRYPHDCSPVNAS